MKHIDVYFLLTIGTEKYYHDNLTITHILNTKLGIPWNPNMQEQFFASPQPKTFHKVQWLVDQGFTRSFIGEYLNITRQSVANALIKPDKEYVNPWLYAFVRGMEYGEHK